MCGLRRPIRNFTRAAPLKRPRRATAGLITLDRSLGAPAPDKGLAPHERGLSHVEGRPANAEALPAVESGTETGAEPINFT